MAGPDAILSDAEWLAHRHVEGGDAIRFQRVPRGRHGEIPFLTDDCLGESGETVDFPIERCLAAVPPGPLHFLFHSAFCGSTMLARAFDRRGLAMGLSEPVLLNDVVGLRRRGAQPPAVARLADCASRLLARPFAPGEAVLVKPSNVVNPLAELLLALNPQARAIFLYAPLDTFLVSVARKGLACRLWVRELAEGYLAEQFLAPLGLTVADLLRQTDLQIAAVGWLAQHRHFLALQTSLGRERIALLDSETMTGLPSTAIEAVARHLGLAVSGEQALAMASGDAFSRHSKTGASYSPEARTADYAAARAAYGEEIDKVVEWAGQVARGAGIVLDPPGRLAQLGA